MPKLLSISRAARLAGVTRSEIQNKIREEDVNTFEGKLTMDLLLEIYPHIDIEADSTLDRIQHIKANARPKSSYSDGWVPDPDMLKRRLKELHRALVHTKSTLNASEILVEDALDELLRSVEGPEERRQNSVKQCIIQLKRVLQRMNGTSNATVTPIAKETLPQLVSTSVRILPSGHEFLLEGSDTILEAGLKAGFYLDYGCSSHNCGKCKCKVLSGGIYKIHDHDYLLSAREQQEGYILACCYTADSELVIEASEAGMEEDLPYQEIRAVVRKITREGDKLALLHIQTPRSQTLRFKAGQQVEFVTEDGIASDLYIASCPCDGRNLQFLVTHKPGDILSDNVFNAILTKQTVLLKGPVGHFVLQKDSTAPALFLANGKGFAPIKSLLEQAINIDNFEGLHLIQVGCYPSGSSLDNLCRAWNDSLENFFYTAISADTSIADLTELLAAALSGTPHVDVYIAGPSDWLQELLETAQSKSLSTENWQCQAVD